MSLSVEEKAAIFNRAIASVVRRRSGAPVTFDLDLMLVVVIVAQLQVAFRHPGNTGDARRMAEKFVRELIEQLDPERGDLYKLLMMGFDSRFDE